MDDVRIDFLHGSVQAFHSVDSRLVVSFCACTIAVAVAKTFDEVETETVYFVFRHPESQYVYPVALHQWVFLTDVFIYAPIVGRGCVVEWALAGIVHCIPRMQTGRVVQYYVEYHGDAILVAQVDELFQVVGRTVGLVYCHIGICGITP